MKLLDKFELVARPPSIDQTIIAEISEDAKRAKTWGIVLMMSGLLIQLFHTFTLPFSGVRAMLILTGLILFGFGFLFFMGSQNVPRNRKEIIFRLQRVMADENPKRRLWAAQRLIGYAKEANLTKEEILEMTHFAKKAVKSPGGKFAYKGFVAVDHLIFIREMAVSVPMNRHLRKEFVQIIKPLQKLTTLPDEGQALLADAISYHPSKLPVQAYADIKKLKEEK